MVLDRCPGQDRRFWKPGDIFEQACPHCGAGMEFWKDDLRRRCLHCGASVDNPRFDMGCAKWCAFAEQCLGHPGPTAADTALCDVLIQEMKGIFGPDQRRIRHALAVLDFAERILQREQADPLVVRAAAVLHDVGIPPAERKHGSSAVVYQQVEGPPIARRILQAAGVDRDRAQHVCDIIADHHTAKAMDSPEFRIVWDADRLVNALEAAPPGGAADAAGKLERVLKTHAGRELSRELPGRGGKNDPGPTAQPASHRAEQKGTSS